MKKDIPYHLCCFLNNQSGAFLLPAQKEKEIITFLDVKFINCFIKRGQCNAKLITVAGVDIFSRGI